MALTPISFVQLPIVTLAGWLLFAEAVDGGTLLGAAIILSATFLHRPARRAGAPGRIAGAELGNHAKAGDDSVRAGLRGACFLAFGVDDVPRLAALLVRAVRPGLQQRRDVACGKNASAPARSPAGA